MPEPNLHARQRHRPDDLGHFLKNWIQNPTAIGAVAPSGRLLAKLMATGLRQGARVIELGAGTGTLTQAILDAGVRAEDLFVVEQNAQFLKILARRFPDCPLVAADALSLAEHVPGPGTFDYVISGLPLLFFSPQQKQRLLEQVFELLGPNGALHQFTYSVRCPVERSLRSRLELRSSLIGIAPFNLPPAFVYRLSRL
ncbi:MAG TPA: methyltransferase domain-containing protein [Gammaproteobacteria bacterium]|nr:methyltransferase domain-containing protein [Gammaproteobacteria bacterium]